LVAAGFLPVPRFDLLAAQSASCLKPLKLQNMAAYPNAGRILTASLERRNVLVYHARIQPKPVSALEFARSAAQSTGAI